ncbi:MAG: shikimate dehydrogenase [Planctomycetota bacterium]|nr:MAG: shikimate dehydrogenase [Planctomycetota bacterium]
MCLLIVPVSGDDIDEVRARIDAALSAGANAIELRLDLMGPLSADDVRSLRSDTAREIPFILTIRSAAEGGHWDGDDDERVSRLIEFGPFADFIDVELALWRRSANIRQKIELALHRADEVSHDGGVEQVGFAARRRLILSHHDLKSRPAALHKLWLEMLAEPACHAPKIAWRARSIRDNFEALDLLRDSPRPAIALCMGAEGILSRVVAKKFNAFGTFAALQTDLATAPGQLTIEQFTHTYRWRTIDSDSALYGVIGDPVSHSLSPRIHNAAFADAGLNAIYLPLHVTASYEAFKAFMVEIIARPWLGFRGFSITLPHKENALRFVLESGGRIDAAAQRVGAVNTLCLSPEGALSACNTDYAAASQCLAEAVKDRKPTAPNLRAAVLGAGGVARAVVAALRDLGAEVAIYNRTHDRAEALAAQFGGRALPWNDRARHTANLVVNCTSVGMTPRDDESPLPSDALCTDLIVFDTVYRPRETRLLREARSRGCATVDGVAMFTRQALTQFQIWTGRAGSFDQFESVIASGFQSS